ncbi:MAG: ADP-ribosylglycohydrolase family protein [Thermomicrobiales bacterium]
MSTTPSTLADRYAGTLLGLACGDALGATVEFTSREEIVEKFPNGHREMVGGGWLHTAPGEVTDDTQMTLGLLNAMTIAGVDMNLLTDQFLKWYHSKPKDIGNTTNRSLGALAAGVPWDQAGLHGLDNRPIESAAANGAVMRCAPVALRFRGQPERLVEASLDTARITHIEPRAMWGTVAVNQGIVHLLNGGSFDDLPEAAVAGVENDDVRERVLAARNADPAKMRAGGFVLDTIGAAYWALLNHDNLEETIVAAVALGDDADTTGAVAGALAGAAYGKSAIPRRWLDVLQPREELEAHAGRLLALAGTR